MAPGRFRFDRFLLDPADRRLSRDDATVELNGRYFDALVLLVGEAGRLVSKDRFLDEVWRGVPVTDEALTQCIRTLRKQLGDDAARPRFIETAPKHGYRFIAPVERIEAGAEAPATAAAPRPEPATRPDPVRRVVRLGLAGAAGGGVAGVLGGLLYGVVAASQSPTPGMGAGSSVLLVLVCLTAVLAMIGGAGVGLGIAAATGLASGRAGLWSTVGGAFGGMMVGAVVKLLGLDAFNLLFGRSPGDMTGAPEGVLLGGAIGLGLWLGGFGAQRPRLRLGMAAAGLAGGAAGIVITLLGGRLMGGSLDLLARSFPESRLRLDPIGALFGEAGLGPVSLLVTSGLEGLLFGACVGGAMILSGRSLRRLSGRSE